MGTPLTLVRYCMPDGFSAPSFDDICSGVCVLVFLDDSTMSEDFLAMTRLSATLDANVFFIEATPENAKTYQFVKFPQVRVYVNGNEQGSFLGTFDHIVEECLKCIGH